MNKNDQQFAAQKIRAQYIAKEDTELDELRRLDTKVKRPANVFTYIFGSFSAIIMGSGMSLTMTDIGEILKLSNTLVPGIIVGCVGLALVLINYPIYKHILNSRKKKYASEILSLSEKIIEAE